MANIDIFKKINRNAFNEKLIHRYLFERYYFGTSQQRKRLLPERLQKYQINLIVPEGSKIDAGYRVDLEIFFTLFFLFTIFYLKPFLMNIIYYGIYVYKCWFWVLKIFALSLF